jgi:Uma2 family endonuclease
METRIAIPLDEYLHTSFSGVDREYRDGEVIERAMPDYLHGKCQMRLGVYFMGAPQHLHLYPGSEVRVRLPRNRVLIPDVSVFHPTEPQGVPDTPPLIAVEILSPDDRLVEVRSKLEEYRVWGIPHVWLVDPHSRRMYTCEDRLREVDSLEVPELSLTLRPADIFD